MRPSVISGLLCLLLLGCQPSRMVPPDDDTDGAISTSADARVTGPGPDLSQGPPDLAYVCGAYSNYQAMVDGIVRSPCDYDVSKILSIGGNVKTRINPPTITMEFPDGTKFAGSTDGQTFTATRLTTFPFQDGCTWQATETLSGTIDTAHMCTLHASYTYREAPISPPPCATPCTIDANVVINRISIIIG